MAITSLFSKRQKAERGQMDDIFSYDNPPQELRVKVVHVMNDGIGAYEEYQSRYDDDIKNRYRNIVDALCREYGVFKLHTAELHGRNYYLELANFIIKEKNVEYFLDVVELIFKAIETYKFVPDQLIDELNSRFKEHNFGYQYQDGQIIKVDSEFVHAEIIKPALKLLGNSSYSGAKQEFLSAHEHYRQGKNKEALADSLKAFESTMKVICAKRKWPHDPNKDTASKLIQICFDKELIPLFWQNHFSGLRSTLESGIPTSRNKLGGHGQGVEIVDVPDYIAAYVLHQTASAIVFLIEAEKNLK